MGLQSMKRRLENVEKKLWQLIKLLPGERELWRHIRQQIGEPDLSEIAALWSPVVHRAMRARGHGDGSHSTEEIREYMVTLKAGPMPARTFRQFLPTRSTPDGFPEGPVVDRPILAADAVGHEGPFADEGGNGQDSSVNLKEPARLDGVSHGEVERYRDLILGSDPMDDWNLIVTDQMQETWEFVPDNRLRITLDHGIEDADAGPEKEDWATRHEDPHARAYRHRVLFSGHELEAVVLVRIDGGRAWLPRPRKSEDAMCVDPFEYKVAQVINGENRLEEYMRRSGLPIPA